MYNVSVLIRSLVYSKMAWLTGYNQAIHLKLFKDMIL